MGKPYGHQYFFAGNGSSTGTMVCKKCNQPIFNHNQDWMSYKKSKSYDWSYHCFHRKCYDKQQGWVQIEEKYKKEVTRANAIKAALLQVANEFNITSPYEFADCAANSLGESDLDGHYFYLYGSC